ncbi:MAG: hypothetical protein HZA79_08750 [Sphingobacteriales bacterium]|nr:hypothetical protein [Sphingobacteriales bacterium]
MKNKDLAFDVLLKTLVNPDDTTVNTMAASLSAEDIAELNNVLPAVRQQAMQINAFQKQVELANSNMGNTYQTLINLKQSLDEAMGQARKGYAYVMWMYVIVFYLGIALIITAVVFAALDKTILAIAFGTIGLVDIVTYLLVKPPLELQASRSNYAQLTAALISWFTDLMNLNTYLTTLPAGTSFDKVAEVSKKQMENTRELMDLIETYSEPGKPAK